jgi:RNA polymerase sigma-70 factor (ECF subfamily)
MTTKDPLARYLLRCAGGDQGALEALYSQVAPRLYAVCLVLLKREDLAEDVLQESFVKIWNRADSFDPARGNALTWMTSIVRNRALDLLRSAHLKAERSAVKYRDVDFSHPGDQPEALADTASATQAVMDCLDQLKESQRRCILLAYYYGHTHEELTRIVQAPLGTVKAWIRRGIERLRECLD